MARRWFQTLLDLTTNNYDNWCISQAVSINVSSFGTGKIDDDAIIALIGRNFDLRPKAIVQQLNLLRPIYQATAAYGHFGRELDDFTWERTDKAEILKSDAGL